MIYELKNPYNSIQLPRSSKLQFISCKKKHNKGVVCHPWKSEYQNTMSFWKFSKIMGMFFLESPISFSNKGKHSGWCFFMRSGLVKNLKRKCFVQWFFGVIFWHLTNSFRECQRALHVLAHIAPLMVEAEKVERT